MTQFQTDDLEYVGSYYDVADSEDDDFFGEPQPGRNSPRFDPMDSDFEDDFESSKSKNDTTAGEARQGKDIQGIPWERLNFARDKYREARLKQYKNYESLSGPREELEKECLEVDKGKTFYDFQFNTRLVKSTIPHFQLWICYEGCPRYIRTCKYSCKLCHAHKLRAVSCTELRNLLWATSKHDVYLIQNYSVMHWSSLLCRGKEVLNVAKPVVPRFNCRGSLPQTLSRVQISTMAVKEGLLVAGGFQGELICKSINQPGVAFCSKLTTEENAITNSVDVYCNSSGSKRVMAANNDAQVRVFDANTFACLNHFSYDWSVNNTSASPDGKLVAILGDSDECLLADANSGKITASLKGHLDYSFASAWHPDGNILATGNQDTTCRLWDVRNPSQSLAVLKGRMGTIRALKFSSDGRFLAMAEPADFIHIFDTGSGYRSCQEIDLFGEIAGISFSPDTEALFVGVADRTYGSLLEFNLRRYTKYMEAMF